jgi:hypothetical protein
MENMIGRLLGGIYIALKSALPDENAEIAHEILFRFSENPEVRPEDRRIYRLIAQSASRPTEEIVAENEEFDRQQSHPQLKIINGGNNAA